MRAEERRHIPVVLSVEEVRRVIALMSGASQLAVKLLYGSGSCDSEAVRLRVKDVDFEMKQIVVRSGKGSKDRVTPFADSLATGRREHLERVRETHRSDLEGGFGAVYLPGALERRDPNATKEWGWQCVFPAQGILTDPRSGKRRWHHID